MRVEGRQLRVLVVYYSSAGHTRTIAEQVAKTALADLEELRGVGEPAGTGVWHYVWTVRRLLLSQRPALAPLQHDARDYDLIILGSPVWLGTFSPFLRSYIRAVPLGGKRIALFCSYRNSPGSALKHVARMLKKSDVLPNTLSILDPVAAGTSSVAIRTQRWVRDLENTLASEVRSL
ncbi:MAG: flavodoxin family protein [Candidatus Cryosericum sp.]